MRSALVYLLFNSWKNRLLMRLRRLRQPKYLMGAIVGGLYVYFYFFRFLFFQRGGQAQSGAFGLGRENLALFESLGAGVLCVIVVLAWVIPHERSALIFTEAEIAFLFPAPVKRRTLIHFKLLKSQLRILVTIVIFTLLFRWSSIGGAAVTRALGWWVIFSMLNLHFLGASFARTMLIDHGISNWKRRVIVLGLLVAALAVVVVWCEKTIPGFEAGKITGLDELKDYAKQALAAGPLPYMLYPFRLVVRPYLSPDFHTFSLTMGPAIVLLGLHYLWVVRSNVAFEEASADASQKMAERIANIRANRGQFTSKPTKKKRPPFVLRPVGPVPIGIVWKNLIGAGSAFTFRFWFFCIWIAVVSVIISSATARAFNVTVIIALLSMVFLAMSFFFGPHLVRQDFRTDLPMADVLKTYPMRGWQVALGELLAPAAILTFVQWLLIMIAAGTTAQMLETVPIELRLAAAASLAIIAPLLNMVTLIIPNAAVLLFPGWFQPGKDAPQGIEATGQRLIFALGQLLALIVVLLPAMIVSAIVGFVVSLAVGPVLAIPVGAACMAIVMGVEVWFGLMWLGRLFEKFDLTAE